MTDLVLSLLAAILAIVLHEVAHGYAALALGDDTARRAGRLTLNPIAHVDRVGTLIVPGALLVLNSIFGGQFMFGWAKPVPVDPRAFRHPRQYMALVALAGPASNFALAWIAAYALRLTPDGDLGELADAFLASFILFNLILGLFNLLPVPPLDGGRIAVGVLPLPMAIAWARLERVGLLIVVFLVFLLPMLLRDFGAGGDPVQSLLGAALQWAIQWLPLPSGPSRV